MKDEIKEILDYLGNDKNYNCDCNDGSYYLELPYREAHELKDCITNLQEDLKYQKEMYDEYCDKHTKLMQEYSNLKKENEVLNKGIEYAKRIEKDYKTRFDKAIEYIKEEQQKFDEMGDSYCYLDEYEINDLIKILQGSDNSEKQ